MPLTADYVLTELERHKAELRALGVRRLGLFGSVARDEARPDSDLDFLVEFDPVTYDAYLETEDFLERQFGCKVDLGSFGSIRPQLQPSVLRELRYATLE